MDIEVKSPARWRGEALLIPFRRSTYRSVGSLLISLPLGIGYAAFIIAGFALGFGLLPVVVGIPILSLTLTVSWRLVALERRLAARVLGEQPREPEWNEVEQGSWWSTLRARMVDRRTYWGAIILIAKFPVGIADLIVFALALVPILAILGTVITIPFDCLHAWFSILAIDGIPTIVLAFVLMPIAWLGTLHLLVGAARYQARLTLRAYDTRVPTSNLAIEAQADRPAFIEVPPPDRFERLGT